MIMEIAFVVCTECARVITADPRRIACICRQAESGRVIVVERFNRIKPIAGALPTKRAVCRPPPLIPAHPAGPTRWVSDAPYGIQFVFRRGPVIAPHSGSFRVPYREVALVLRPNLRVSESDFT